jgi:hypothetical protein
VRPPEHPGRMLPSRTPQIPRALRHALTAANTLSASSPEARNPEPSSQLDSPETRNAKASRARPHPDPRISRLSFATLNPIPCNRLQVVRVITQEGYGWTNESHDMMRWSRPPPR